MPQKGDPGVNGEGGRSTMRATRYEIAEIVPQVRRLLSERREIGLHGIDAWRDSSKGRTELDRIRRVTDASEMGVRMHWLFFDEKSPAILEEAGFSYDSTIGYNETVGYRAGTTQAFKPLGVERILELPMHIMDTALFYPDYLSLSPNQARTVIAPLIENAVRFGGVLTVNWHDRSIAPERLWDDFYVSLLEELRSHGPWFPTAAQAVSWFRKRRSAVFEGASRDGEAIRVKVALNQDDESLPGLRLRVHKAPVLQTRESRSAMPDSAFTDTHFNRSGEIQVAI
jgi:hypothetical protein